MHQIRGSRNIPFRSLVLLIALVVLAPGCRPRPEGNGWNVIVVTLETTRADHLGAHGYDRPTSPSLDRLADEMDTLLAEDVDPVREYHISDEAHEQLRSLGYVN